MIEESPLSASPFTGTLGFSVAGPGVSIDPLTGAVSIAADRLEEGVEVAVVATPAAGDAGAVRRRFRLMFHAVAPILPRLVAQPALAGPAVVGAAVAALPGTWEGAEALALQWRLDGADIAGATGPDYRPALADEGRALSCRVTATNADGAAGAETAAVPVVHAAPRVVAPLADLVLELDSGPARVAAAAAFAGAGLGYAVAGAGATIDALTGEVTLPTAALLAETLVTVIATNSGGSAEARFRVRVAGVAPALVAAPRLTGRAEVGALVGVEPGAWAGKPAPDLALSWLRDGAPIAGATGASYRPVAADDGRALSCRVSASNVAGSAAATTAALGVTRAAPVARGTLADVSLVEGAAPGRVAAAAAFAGEALVYSVSGAGAAIDALTGEVTLPTAVPRAAEPVTVTATNSGGSAATAFRVTVTAAAAVTPPVAVGRVADVRLPLDGGTHSVSTQAHFAGEDLVFALDAAPAGVTVMPGSGLVEIVASTGILGAIVTVRASNAGGSATQSFALTVAGGAAAEPAETVFDASAKLAEVGFVHEGAAPGWTLRGGVQARLSVAPEGRVHADWKRAGGDGLYRALVRWNAGNTGARGSSPFVFGARIAKEGADFRGLYAEATRISGVERQLRLLEYTGTGSATRLLAAATSDWVWYSWYWFEMELVGAAVKARLYAKDAPAPAWQLEAATSRTAGGLFGPSGFPIEGVGPFVDVQRLEFVPATAAPTAPAAATDGDWDLSEITEQK
jgi:hypothetical protein